MKSYRDAVKDIESRKNDRSKLTIKNTRKALKKLGLPQDGYRTTLVGGTNGKGSTVEMTSRILQERNMDVGTFKSPHLITVRERIRVNSEMITKEEFMRYYERINSLNLNLSFFEFTTVMSYLHFNENNIDQALVEVGMGGKLDATNAIENQGAAITNVGRDHSEYLGETKEEIAEEKAGIIPEGGFLINGTSMEIIHKIAKNKSAEIETPEKVEYKDGKYIWNSKELDLPVKGNFQAKNLGMAIKLAKIIDAIPEDLEASLGELKCRGRMEIISEDPLYIHDGAHNLRGIKQSIKSYPDDAIIVFGVMQDKPEREMIEILESTASEFYFTEARFNRSKEPHKLTSLTRTKSRIIKPPEKAVEEALTDGRPVVVTGSLYLVGDIKQARNE